MASNVTESTADPQAVGLTVYPGGDGSGVHITSTFPVTRSDGRGQSPRNHDELLQAAVDAGVITSAQRTAFVGACVSLRSWLATRAGL